MAKVALLIGVSEYELGLTSLPSAVRDVEAMQRVLQHPEIGNFDEIKTLINPQTQEMAKAIETLFDGRQRDDLILLFFSGHGIKDESGKLYFSTRNTCKTETGSLFKATTVPASFVHDVMSNSRSRREVVILDCCFSGAFAEGMPAKDNGFVDVKNQLGGEGRAILTSSTSTQYSFEDTGTDTSTYTRYVVEGLETGAADKDEDGWITVDELHEYATRKVQEAAPAMKPEIYPIKEGYTILIAKAPLGDPKLGYRKKVESFSRNGEISSLGRRSLDQLRMNLNLSSEEALAIENEVLQPYRDYQNRLNEYEKAYIEEVEKQFTLSIETKNELQVFQQILALRNEDIAPILAKYKPSSLNIFKNIFYSNFLHYRMRGIDTFIVGGIIGAIVSFIVVTMVRPQYISRSCPVKERYVVNDKMSVGEEILLTQDTNSDKQAGVKAFTNGDCQTAIQKFESYRTANPTDPEALIYLNNAKAIRRGDPLKIAVSVPIGTNQGVAKEMLRGVAQAQDEVNFNGGINGKLLKVAIANDNNDPSEAVQIATRVGEDTNILAVVGHNSSNASLSAAPVYQQYGLVMMTPTSYAPNLSNVGNYIFRTAPNVKSIADEVSDYAIKTASKTNFLMCFDPQSLDNLLFKDRFIESIKAASGQINPTDCNISTRNFDPQAIIDQAVRSGANALVLAIYIERIQEGLAIARANQRKLAVFSSSTLFQNDILEEGKDIDGMIIAIPWHSQAFPDKSFEQNARNL